MQFQHSNTQICFDIIITAHEFRCSRGHANAFDTDLCVSWFVVHNVIWSSSLLLFAKKAVIWF